MQTVNLSVQTLVWFQSLTSKTVSIMRRGVTFNFHEKLTLKRPYLSFVISDFWIPPRALALKCTSSKTHEFPHLSSGGDRWFGRNWTTVRKHQFWLSFRTLCGGFIQQFVVTCSPPSTLPDAFQTFPRASLLFQRSIIQEIFAPFHH